MDEPDSGLDGGIAQELMQSLRTIADQGKIVLDIAGEKKQQMTEEKLLQLYSEHFSDEMLLS